MIRSQPEFYGCAKCKRVKTFPRYSCRTCCYAFTSNFKLDVSFNSKYQQRKIREASDERLVTLYQRIKERYFDGAYVPESRLVTFAWKRSHKLNGSCLKSMKLIKIGGLYKFAFIRRTDLSPTANISAFNKARRRGLVELMIHEMLHLRLAHHKKSFKRKEVQIKAKVKDEHIEELFQGLITE